MKPFMTDTKLNNLLKTAVVIIDTREQDNEHIKNYFDKVKIPYVIKKLDFGDYGLVLPKNDEFGIGYDMVIDFAVERKHNLEELSSNLTGGRTRFEEELWRGNGKMALVIENGTFDMILNGYYSTNYDKNSFIATLIAFYHRYDISYWFVEKANSGKIIYGLLKYKLREELK